MEVATPSYTIPHFASHSFTSQQPRFTHNFMNSAPEDYPPVPKNINFTPAKKTVSLPYESSYTPPSYLSMVPPVVSNKAKIKNKYVLEPKFTAQNVMPRQDEPILYMKGDHVPLSDKGYQLLVRWGSIDDMVVFVRRVVENLSMLGIENDSIIELAETFMDRPQTFDRLVVDLRSGSGIQKKRKGTSRNFNLYEKRKVRFVEDDASTDSVQVDEHIIPSGKLDKSELSDALQAMGWRIDDFKFGEIVEVNNITQASQSKKKKKAHLFFVKIRHDDGEVYQSEGRGWDKMLALKQVVYDICRHCKLGPEYEEFIETDKENLRMKNR